MCNFRVTHPMRRKPVGRMHMTKAKAVAAALRAAKRQGADGHANVEHWRDGRVATVFADGSVVWREEG
jgi:hypothetical protein